MKYLFLMTGIAISLLGGFIFAGLKGACLFGGLITMLITFWKKKEKQPVSMRTAAATFLCFSVLSYLLMQAGGLLGANPEVRKKLALIEKELEAGNYDPSWIIISQKRNSVFNGLLRKSASKSYHLQGRAIDLYVFDLNGDFQFNKEDLCIMETATREVERKHPELAGGLVDYDIAGNGYLTRHMIHIDTRGYPARLSR